MIKLENVVLASPDQMSFIIQGLRNPMNSWEKSDSYENYSVEFDDDLPGVEIRHPYYRVGAGDISLMQRLANAGTDHRKFMRMMPVYVRITAPLYWWKEFDTYKVATVANSCSTMHKIQEKEFTLEDFSCEHLFPTAKNNLKNTIEILNAYRTDYINEECGFYHDKDVWWQMIQLLPSSYNQTRNVMMNYEVLCNVYKSRKSHRLDEWVKFCKWIEELPYHELVCGPDSLREKFNRPSCGVIPNALRESIGMETIPDSEAKRHLELGKAIGEGFRKGFGIKED